MNIPKPMVTQNNWDGMTTFIMGVSIDSLSFVNLLFIYENNFVTYFKMKSSISERKYTIYAFLFKTILLIFLDEIYSNFLSNIFSLIYNIKFNYL